MLMVMTAADIYWMLIMYSVLCSELSVYNTFILLTASRGSNHTVPVLQMSGWTQRKIKQQSVCKEKSYDTKPSNLASESSLFSSTLCIERQNGEIIKYAT